MNPRAPGEDQLIAELTRGLVRGKNVRSGIGDDCAVVGTRSAKKWLLLKTDCIIEDVHFTGRSDPFQIGWKAAARALSDVAAMGGIPLHALVTIAIPAPLNVVFLKAIYRGLNSALGKFGAAIVGGETARSPANLFLSIALAGEVEPARCVTRSGGKVGDAIFVTGRLGNSIRGKHLTFTPRIAEARWLTKNFHIHAMMDLSDGLGTDLPRLARSSGVDFEIEEKKLPLTRGSDAKNALGDGEDYELLFTVAPKACEKLERSWSKKFPALPLTRIGLLTQKSKNRNQTLPRGFDHFA